MREPSRSVNLGCHKRNCTICAHTQCEEIERDFVNWKSPAAITAEYGLVDRTTVYRHSHALDLFTTDSVPVLTIEVRLVGGGNTPNGIVTTKKGPPYDAVGQVVFKDGKLTEVSKAWSPGDEEQSYELANSLWSF